MDVTLTGIATALAPHDLPQDVLRARAEAILGPRYPQFARMIARFEQAGIDRRRSVAPLDWFETEGLAWEERSRIWHAGCAAMRAERPPRSAASSPSPRPASPRRRWRPSAGRRWGSAAT